MKGGEGIEMDRLGPDFLDDILDLAVDEAETAEKSPWQS